MNLRIRKKSKSPPPEALPPSHVHPARPRPGARVPPRRSNPCFSFLFFTMGLVCLLMIALNAAILSTRLLPDEGTPEEVAYARRRLKIRQEKLVGNLKVKQEELVENLKVKQKELVGNLKVKQEELVENLKVKQEKLVGNLKSKQKKLAGHLKSKQEKLAGHLKSKVVGHLKSKVVGHLKSKLGLDRQMSVMGSKMETRHVPHSESESQDEQKESHEVNAPETIREEKQEEKQAKKQEEKQEEKKDGEIEKKIEKKKDEKIDETNIVAKLLVEQKESSKLNVPVAEIKTEIPLPTAGSTADPRDAPDPERRDAVRDAMRHAWSGYEKHAFGKDEVRPLSGKAVENWGGMGNTLVDSLDTLWIMGMREEFDRATDWVRDNLHYSPSSPISTFETTIRSLGGLLAAYDRSGDAVFLTKAVDLGDRLLAAFNTKSGLPSGQSLLRAGTGGNAGWLRGSYVLAEVATLQVEFRYLAAVTGNPIYATTSEKVFHKLKEIEPADGLYPYMLGWNSGTGKLRFTNTQISFGAMGDSFYEYLLKVWIQGGKKESMYREMYDKSIDGMANKLIQKTKKEKLTYIAERSNGRLQHKMDHLACFMGGLLALGAYTDPGGLESTRAQRDLQLAKDITYTCYQMYKMSPSGIGPENVFFNCRGKELCAGSAVFYMLRPETVESLFVLHHLTGDPVYREWGWEIFQSIEKHCKTDIGYATLHDVTKPVPPKEDKMESFFLAETIKYIYLLFAGSGYVDLLGKHVFNTEAHPLRWITDAELLQKVGTKVS